MEKLIGPAISEGIDTHGWGKVQPSVRSSPEAIQIGSIIGVSYWNHLW
jgi:hypothetical protein